MEANSPDVTGLLRAWSSGDRAALEALIPAIEGELRRLARRYLAREAASHTLETTALIHEAYLRLLPARGFEWHDREHFYAVSARIMRRILVDAARARLSGKRGGGMERIPLGDELITTASDGQIVALNHALDALAQFDARKAHVVELRYFGGLNAAETAVALHVSQPTVLRDWKLAKAWLARELKAGEIA